MSTPSALTLEETILAVYCALDDALACAKVECREGKLIPRPGPPPAMDDREVLCLALLQELLGYESDHAFFLWLQNNSALRTAFPHLLSRQKFAERRVLLTPLLERLCQAFCVLGGEGLPPFPSSTPIPSTSAASSGREDRSVSAAWPPPAIALP